MPARDNRPMSIDAMLDMERREVLALLENKHQAKASPDRERRSASPYATPRSPVRSMLDIEEEPTVAKSRQSSNRQAPVRSMLDTDSPMPPSSKPLGGSNTTPNSPASSIESGSKHRSTSQSSHHRSMSDASFKPADFGPRSSRSNDPTSEYQFSGIFNPHSGNQQSQLRAAQAGNRSQTRANALSEALRNSDLSGLRLPGERGRDSSLSGLNRLGNKSRSPHNRLNNRSRSPATFAPQLSQGKTYLNDGKVLDLNNAYRRLSDANLAYSTGSLSQLPMRKTSADPGEGRLIKDYLGPDGEQLGSSEDEESYSTDDETRGRKKEPRALNPDAKGESSEGKSRSRSAQRKTMTLLAAAEEERKSTTYLLKIYGSRLTMDSGTQIAGNYKYEYRSLIPEPEIKITNSSGDTVKPSKNAVHPHTSYDQGPGSATPSMIDSDEEADFDDIRRAQKLSFSMTNILSKTEGHRAVRIIYRGEYDKIARTAEEEHRRLRKYLVATDLSDESTHALEWAIGTVLRDGDTLIAIYCVDEETGIVAGDGSQLPDDPKAMKEQAAAINSMTSSKSAPGGLHLRGESANNTPGTSPAPSARGANKAEEERYRAVRDITDRVLRLLRKTQLQVRVIVEVLHCKNPKHMITEVIDLVDPTLVVIGSRGRSALKG